MLQGRNNPPKLGFLPFHTIYNTMCVMYDKQIHGELHIHHFTSAAKLPKGQARFVLLHLILHWGKEKEETHLEQGKREGRGFPALSRADGRAFCEMWGSWLALSIGPEEVSGLLFMMDNDAPILARSGHQGSYPKNTLQCYAQYQGHTAELLLETRRPWAVGMWR